MKMLVKVLPLLVAVILGSQPGEATINADLPDVKVSHFLHHNTEAFLAHVKSRFETSLTDLFTGNAFGDQSMQRPGLAKLLREESDRNWNLGIETLKKYLQRGGSVQNEHFLNQFKFTGENAIRSIAKNADIGGVYLQQFENLVKDCKSTAIDLNTLVQSQMGRTNGGHKADAEMVHFLEEKMEEEVGLMHKFHHLYTSLKKMAGHSLAQYTFDKHLVD